MKSFEMEPASGPRFQVRTTSSRVMIEVKDNWVALLPGEAIRLSEMLMGCRSYTDTEEFDACHYRPWSARDIYHRSSMAQNSQLMMARRNSSVNAPNNLEIHAYWRWENRAIIEVTCDGSPRIDCDLTHPQAETVANWLLLCAEDLGELPELFPEPPHDWLSPQLLRRKAEVDEKKAVEEAEWRKKAAAHAAKEIEATLSNEVLVSSNTVVILVFLAAAAALLTWLL